MPKILVIDSDQDATRQVTSYIASLGYEVLTAHMGARGLELARAYRPGLVVLGLILPDMYGAAIHRDLRITPGTIHTPIVLLAPEETWSELRAGLKLGPYDYLVNPANLEELGRVIQHALSGGRRRAGRERTEEFAAASQPEEPLSPGQAPRDGDQADEAKPDAPAMISPQGELPDAAAPGDWLSDLEPVPAEPLRDESEGGVPAEAPPPPPSPAPAQPAAPLRQPAPEPEAFALKMQAEAETAPGTLAGGGQSYQPVQDVLKEAQAVQFAAYYPKEMILNDWQQLIAYVYKALAAEKIAEDAQKQLGDLFAMMRRVTERARQKIKEGALITATPNLPGFQFNPPSLSVGFYEDWHRLDFKLRAMEAPLNQAANGRLTFTAEGVIVADIPLSIFVGETITSGETVSAAQKLYQAIFCSYSHDDTHIVERVERAYKALGLDYLRDVYALKSGQDWDDQLLKLIEQADIFQLFWSKAAAHSQYVRQEWEHALKLNRETAFIRPVYWEQPLPPVPPELGHIHFTYQPELVD